MSAPRLLSLAGLIAVSAGLYNWHAPTRLRALVWLGRANGCTIERALEAPADLKRQIEIKDRILSASRRLQTDKAGYVLWETPKGNYWVPEGSDFVLPFNLAEQERDIYSAGPVQLKAGDIVLDCGANVGVYTRKALDAGASQVIAIEPAPENIECLRRNFKAEIEQGRVVVYPKGVWDKEDMLVLHVHPQNSAADSFVIEQKGSHASDQKLPLTTIDNMVAELKLDRVDFIKMDIEGAEVRALKGAHAALAKYHPRLAISVYHEPEDPVRVPRAVLDGWDGYQTVCGPCAELRWRVRPDILLFH